MQPAVVKTDITFQDAMRALASSMAAPEHVFWALDYPISELRPELAARIVSHLHLTDALLLDLAVRKQGRLATLDRRLANLLPLDSPTRSALQILPVE